MRDAVGFGFWRFAAGNVAAAVRESRTALSPAAFVAEARKYVPDIDTADVTRGPRGIRAQAMDARGRLVDDFVITGTDRVARARTLARRHLRARDRRAHRHRGAPARPSRHLR